MDETLWGFLQRNLTTSGGIERATVILLLVLSVVSWAVIMKKGVDYYLAVRNGKRFLRLMATADSFGTAAAAEFTVGPSPLLSIFQGALRALETAPAGSEAPAAPTSDPRRILFRPARSREDLVAMAMQDAAQEAFLRLKHGLILLAIIGSTSPFIGLFGTVWGIMSTFRSLSTAESATLAVVAPGISSALIATAAGLFVAIPAVVGYNWYLGHINRMQDDADLLMDRLLALIRASRDGSHAPAPAADPARAVPKAAGAKEESR